MQGKINVIKEKLLSTKEAKELFLEALFFVIAFSLTPVRFLFGIYPFGIALLGGAKKQAPFVFAGSLLSVLLFMDVKAVYVVALIGEMGLRISASLIKRADFVKTELGQNHGSKIAELLFCESVELRVAIATLTSLGVSIYTVIANGYIYYDIFALVFGVVFVGIITFCLSGLWNDGKREGLLIGIGALLFSLSFALSGKELFGIDVVVFLSYSAVLYASKCLGGIKGAAFGVLLGVAQGGVMSSTLGICGLVGGFLWSLSPYLSIMSAFVLSIGYAISLIGYEAVVLIMPELLASSLIMYPLLRFELLPRPAPLHKKEVKGMESYRIESASHHLKLRMEELTEAYSGVAEILKGIGEKTKAPDKRGYLDMALETSESYCYSCPKHDICWKRDIETTNKNINRMGRVLFANGDVTRNDVEEKFLHRCPNIDRIMEDLRNKNKEIFKGSIKNDKMEALSQGYGEVSKILSSAFDAESKTVVERELTDKAVRIGSSMGLVCDKIEVLRGKKREVVATGVDIQRSKCTSEALRQEMERGLCLSLEEAQIIELDEYAILKIEEKHNFSMEIKCQTLSLGEKEQNGDSFGHFVFGSQQYMVICDGMGSGRDASLTSGLCIDLLKKMLSVSQDKRTIMSMLNSLVRAKNTECSSTVDLFQLDLVSGEGAFVKSGACPSFIKRGDQVYKLQSKTAPLGIIKSLDAEELSFNVAKGDICVMVSDGVIPTKQDCHWLMQYLSDYKEEDIDFLSREIVKEAKKRGGNDDITVICGVIN